MSGVGSPPFLSIHFKVVRLALFCGVMFRMGVSEGGMGGVSVVVEFLEGIAWYSAGMLLWVNVGLSFFFVGIFSGWKYQKEGWVILVMWKDTWDERWGNVILGYYGMT